MAGELMTIDGMTKALDQCRFVEDAAVIQRKASALGKVLKVARAGLDLQNNATRVKMLAERKAGELLERAQRRPRARTDLSAGHVAGRSAYAEMLSETQIGDREARRWRLMATVTEDRINAFVAHASGARREASSRVLLGQIEAESREKKRSGRDAALRGREGKMPARKFGLILADPPWQYGAGTVDPTRVAENHYPTMPIPDIAAFGQQLQAHLDRSAVLFLWATAPMLADAITTVLPAWGFGYKAALVWDKEIIGAGYWVRQRHEYLLLCVRGNARPPSPPDRPPSVFAARRLAHSEKPAIAYDIIERMYPDLRRLELFARGEPRAGWTAWGNEVETLAGQRDDL